MSETFEINHGLLEQFHTEIKRIIAVVGKNDANIGAIASPDTLGGGELVVWSDFKKILQDVRALEENNAEDVGSELDRLYQLCIELDKKIKVDIDLAKEAGNDSRIYFGAWLQNKNPASKIRHAKDLCIQNGARAALEHLKQRMKQILDVCLGS